MDNGAGPGKYSMDMMKSSNLALSKNSEIIVLDYGNFIMKQIVLFKYRPYKARIQMNPSFLITDNELCVN